MEDRVVVRCGYIFLLLIQVNRCISILLYNFKKISLFIHNKQE